MSILLLISSLLILAYLFDLSSSKTKIPSVILLLLLGWVVGQTFSFFAIKVPDLMKILPILGSIGLILIVLEGSLEIELNKSRLPALGKASLVTLIPMIVLCVVISLGIYFYSNANFQVCLSNALPFAIISGVITIPNAEFLSTKMKAFINYESSLSDIFGVILFNFITLNETFGAKFFGDFIVELLMMLSITFFATLLLALLLSKISNRVKFAPIILITIIIYSICKLFHLPGAIFILLFGIFVSNIDELKHMKFISKLKPDMLQAEVTKFRELTTEITFLIRSLFFLLFGFLIKTEEILNPKTIYFALFITCSIFLIRFFSLKVFKIYSKPLLFFAPRGLITILLFLSLPVTHSIGFVNKSLIIQVIILTSLVMMYGSIIFKVDKNSEDSYQNNS